MGKVYMEETNEQLKMISEKVKIGLYIHIYVTFKNFSMFI